MTESTAIMPQDVSDLAMAFPGSVAALMPPMDEIPQEFRDLNHRLNEGWNALVSDWFFLGLTKLDLEPKDGIDESAAVRHVRTVMGSFEPKHEHKQAACAYLLSLWFKSAAWTTKRGARGSAVSA